LKTDAFASQKLHMRMPSFSLLFSFWLFVKLKNRQWLDTIDDFQIGAGEGNRTLVWSLENSRSTIELRPLPNEIITPALALSTAAR
jgi:hypothetical protein